MKCLTALVSAHALGETSDGLSAQINGSLEACWVQRNHSLIVSVGNDLTLCHICNLSLPFDMRQADISRRFPVSLYLLPRLWRSDYDETAKSERLTSNEVP